MNQTLQKLVQCMNDGSSYLSRQRWAQYHSNLLSLYHTTLTCIKGMEITSNKISEKHHSTSLVLNSYRLNKYKTTSFTGIKTEEQYLRLESELVELDYHQFKIISADNITAYLLPKKREIHTAESLRKQHQRFRDLLMFQDIAY